MITEYTNICVICGKTADHPHHLVFGKGRRNIADSHDLIIPVCYKCHSEIHSNGVAGKLSKIAGQLAFEKYQSREDFRRKFGKSYL